MIDLQLMRFAPLLKVQSSNEVRRIWDPIRKRWLVLQPEEMVRQLILTYLLSEKRYPASKIVVEKRLIGHHLQKRFDVLVYAPSLKPFLLVECKAPEVAVDQQVFLQAANYNLALSAAFFLLTNGRTTYCCALDEARREVRELSEIPDYPFL